MSVGRICTRSVDTAHATEDVRTAAQRMRDRAVGTLVVLDQDKRPVGLLTDRDLAVRVLAAGKDPQTTIVGEVATPAPETIGEDAAIEHALAIMRRGRFRRLPVVNSGGELVGILSLDDVLDLLTEEFRDVAGLLHTESAAIVTR